MPRLYFVPIFKQKIMIHIKTMLSNFLEHTYTKQICNKIYYLFTAVEKLGQLM